MVLGLVLDEVFFFHFPQLSDSQLEFLLLAVEVELEDQLVLGFEFFFDGSFDFFDSLQH